MWSLDADAAWGRIQAPSLVMLDEAEVLGGLFLLLSNTVVRRTK